MKTKTGLTIIYVKHVDEVFVSELKPWQIEVRRDPSVSEEDFFKEK